MKKTFITTMPDHSGAFLEASRIIAAEGANITRVSYNRAVDTHTLFLDVAGSQAQLEAITEKLRRVGYIQNHPDSARVMLVDFILQDVPGAVQPVLELISRYRFNISYINSQENGTGWQAFRMGLFIENPRDIRDFLDAAARLCEVRIVDYDESARALDNTVFYMRFAESVAKKLQFSRRQARQLTALSNQLMQMLESRNEQPYKTFDYIGRFADMLSRYRGEAFQPRLSELDLAEGFHLWCVEPPCGSNVYILRKGDELLFVDSGFAIYAPEMIALLRRMIPDFDNLGRRIVITHPDEDHCGLLNLFDEIYVSPLARRHFALENLGEPNFREQNPAHAPYTRISRILSKYFPPRMACLRVVGEGAGDSDEPIAFLGAFDFCGKRFEVYRGNGGHAVGEVAIVDPAEKLVFSGDIVVNIHGFTPPQDAFNRLAPYLMTSVNMDSAKARQEREALQRLFPPSEYTYCCGHGAIMRPEGGAHE